MPFPLVEVRGFVAPLISLRTGCTYPGFRQSLDQGGQVARCIEAHWVESALACTIHDPNLAGGALVTPFGTPAMAGVPDKDLCQITLLLAADIECHDMRDEMRNFDLVRINPVIIPDAAVFAVELAIAIESAAHCRHHDDQPVSWSIPNKGAYRSTRVQSRRLPPQAAGRKGASAFPR